MKQTHVSQIGRRSPATEVETFAWQEMCQRVLVRDGLRCRVCNASGKLLCHSRTNEGPGTQPRDVLALCQDCYKQAHICRQKRTRTRGSDLVRLACIIALSLATAVIIIALASHLILMLSLLYVVSIYAVLGLDALSRRWF